MMSEEDKKDFITSFKVMQKEVYRNTVEKGFWESNRSVAEAIALIHSELSEALEADRKGLMDNHLPHYKGLVVELADNIIRTMDLCEKLGLPLAEAVIDKHFDINVHRPRLHGKKY